MSKFKVYAKVKYNDVNDLFILKLDRKFSELDPFMKLNLIADIHADLTCVQEAAIDELKKWREGLLNDKNPLP